VNILIVILSSVAIGVLCGLRAFVPLALVSWMSIWGWMPLAGSPSWFLGKTTVAIILTVLAAAELVSDKLPKTPPRIQPAPLAVRIITGALSAAALCFAGGQRWLLGIACGALGGIAGAFGGYCARRHLVREKHIPDFVVAIIEDFVTIAGTLFILRSFFSAPV
jgi:uncharacterized membrane protein